MSKLSLRTRTRVEIAFVFPGATIFTSSERRGTNLFLAWNTFVPSLFLNCSCFGSFPSQTVLITFWPCARPWSPFAVFYWCNNTKNIVTLILTALIKFWKLRSNRSIPTWTWTNIAGRLLPIGSDAIPSTIRFRWIVTLPCPILLALPTCLVTITIHAPCSPFSVNYKLCLRPLVI